MIVQALVKPGEYHDSVALMLIAQELGALPGVDDVSVMMGTPANKAVLQQADLLTAETAAAGPNDLVIVVRAKDAPLADGALRKAEYLLAQKPSFPQAAGVMRPRSVRSAVRATPGANAAVISVPGQYAAAQAWDALRAGLNVLLFSDHVALEDEIALKEYARDHGLLLMGPGAGTAILNGIGLGFANSVPHGDIGIVAAAGTGLQEVSTLIAKSGSGITQGIGTGGRDVSEAVGGIMMLEGLKALQADPETHVIVIVSKISSPVVTNKIMAQCRQSDKPTVLAFVGSDVGVPTSNVLFPASDLREAATVAVALARGESVEAARKKLSAEDKKLGLLARNLKRKLNSKQRYIRGLFSGGTLCEEAMGIWQAALGQVWSNAPLNPRFRLADSNVSKQHTAIDLGEEEFTIGRPHPMIDPTLRVRRLLEEARDSGVAAIVLDVVIGYGAHPDPAAELGAAIAEAKKIAERKRRELILIASVTGTENDPQGLARQTMALRKAGGIVMSSNAAAAKLAGWVAQRPRRH